MNRLESGWKGVFLSALCCAFLSGCVAAAIPAMYGLTAASAGAAGFSAYKTVQLSTGGSVEAKFTSSELSEENKMALSTIKGFAIWPSERSQVPVRVAEILDNKGYYTVVTPAKVTSAKTKLGVSTPLESMTQKERQKVFSDVSTLETVDAVFASISLGRSVDHNVFSLNRANMMFKSQVEIYSKEKDKVIWTETLQTVINVGSRSPDQGEIEKAVASVVVDKILEVTGKAENKITATNH